MKNQSDGTSGTYRPVDDIFEEASVKLQGSQGELDGVFNDGVRYFSSLECVKAALTRICEIKGNFLLAKLGEMKAHVKS